MRTMLLAALLGLAAQDEGWEKLTAAEIWADGKGAAPAAGWAFEEGGVVHRTGKAGDIFTRKKYLDFELEFEWKIASGGNSGLKYRMKSVGPEYQVIDDEKHSDAKNAHRQTASLYDVKEPSADKGLKPAGEWNSSKVLAKGKHLEHWLNGKKVMEIDLDSDEWKERFAKSKFAKTKGADAWFAREPGPVMLQDHGDEVWFRALRIRELK
jgi:hypothetical protein